MPMIRVEMWAGRTHEQTQELAGAITDAGVEIGKTTPRASNAHTQAHSVLLFAYITQAEAKALMSVTSIASSAIEVERMNRGGNSIYKRL